MFKSPRIRFLLAGILLLAFVLRVYRVTQVPAGFFADEADIGYNAYLLWHTGHDEHGVSWPIFFQGLGDYRTPVQIYSNIPTLALFGLSEFSVRLVTVLYGVGTVLGIFLLGSVLGGTQVGLLSALVLSVLPWELQVSRWGAEYAPFPCVTVFALYVFIKSLKDRQYIVLSFALLSLGLYTYYPAWVILPLLGGGEVILYLWRWRLQGMLPLLSATGIATVIAVPLLINMFGGQALSRWNNIAHKDTPWSERLQHVAGYYADHFRPEFLFLSGDIGYPGHFINRHSLRGRGELYAWMAAFILIGLVAVLKGWYQWGIILWLLLLYPLGSALTDEGPFATRSIIGIIPFCLLTARGIQWLTGFCHWRLVTAIKLILVAIVLVSVTGYLQDYYLVYPGYSSDFWGWQYGPRDIMAYFLQVQDQYDELIMSADFNAPSIFVPFYSQGQCQKCSVGWINERYRPGTRQLFAVKPSELEKFAQRGLFVPLRTLSYPNGETAFLIGVVQ